MIENEAENRGEVTVDTLLDYFMRLYKVHLGVPQSASSQIVAVEPSRQNPKIIVYNLMVEYNDDQMSRRVTVGPIAEEAGSKSTCFFAIYDSHLVIKIPPDPIVDFKTYISCIKRDRKIVDILSPRVCLIPGVSMILNKVYKFPRINELKGDKREDAYLEWLNYNQDYQRYLKIGGGFAFFMDLSKHMFLSDVMPLFHGLGAELQEEIARDPSILENFEKFEGRYGLENTQIGVDLKEVYKKYDDQARQLMSRTSIAASDMLYKMQSRFFSYISGQPPEQDDKDRPDEGQVPEFNRLLGQVVAENREAVDRYLAMVAHFLRDKRTFQNRPYKEGIVTNIIELLAWVKEKGVAVRDIKPDNLLVAGDVGNYPAFLAAPDRFEIGLIDFETAVVFKPDNGQNVEQPFLGGTSLYATPMQVFNNKVLTAFYKDLPRAFYLQDWYSAVAVIYRIITGESLFSKTSRLFLVVADKLREAKKKNRPAEEVVAEVNSLFWKSAVAEFEANTEKMKEKLQSLRAALCDEGRRMCLNELIVQDQWADQEINRLINLQNLFKSPENREQLSAVTPEQIDHLIKKARAGAGTPTTALTQTLAQLKRIRNLKADVLKNRDNLNRIAASAEDFSVYDLIVFMFNRVERFMNIGRPGM